jgi:hypothetical protein
LTAFDFAITSLFRFNFVHARSCSLTALHDEQSTYFTDHAGKFNLVAFKDERSLASRHLQMGF